MLPLQYQWKYPYTAQHKCWFTLHTEGQRTLKISYCSYLAKVFFILDLPIIRLAHSQLTLVDTVDKSESFTNPVK